MPRLAAPIGLVATLIAVTLAGCGGGSTTTVTATATGTTPTTTTAPAALTREQLVAKLDGICERANVKAAEFEPRLSAAFQARDYSKAASIEEEALRENAVLIREVEQLRPPPELQGAFDRYLTAQRRRQGLLERAVPPLRNRDVPEVQRLIALANQERAARTRAAVDLGTKQCR